MSLEEIVKELDIKLKKIIDQGLHDDARRLANAIDIIKMVVHD